ncbi:hypothetical protein Pint_19527 [Pistacia integerrima]|uniref:Uncharacterized protein n=1 Tax=Pistacia integerrima TaxID=434235 RepID=A0ACC0XFM1_9ROSI|nr:hypothetical protein Pint_19527 [Pistacia integerrima]
MWLMWFRGLGCVDLGRVLVSLSVGLLAFLSTGSVVWAIGVLDCGWPLLGCWVLVLACARVCLGMACAMFAFSCCLLGLLWKLQSWLQLPNGNWELVKIVSTSGKESVVSLPEGKVRKVKSESLISANPDILDGVDDLMQLSYLNGPAVLYNLQYRYKQDTTYTKAGPVLVASNPFKKVPLYGNDYIEAYKNKSIESPHVYAITDTAIREMTRGAFCV